LEEEAAVALNLGANPDTIPALVATRIAAHGDEIILRKKNRGIWNSVTWSELGTRTRAVGMGLKAVGFRPGDVACVLAETRPEFAYVDLGILGAGGVSAAIHPEEEAEALGETLRQSDCRVLFVENDEQLDKVLSVRDRCPALQRIVIFEMKGLRDFADPMCEGFQLLAARGADHDRTHPDEWQTGIAAIANDQPAVLLLPNGGGTAAKGRVLTHGDALHLIAHARTLLAPRVGDERLALLPMCHMIERVFGLYLALDARAVSNYLENPDTVMENLQEVQPTMLGTDRQVWERLCARATDGATGATHVQRLCYRAAIAAAQRGGPSALLARLLVLRAVRRELGLGRLRHAYIGVASLPPEIERWAMALGIVIQQIDGHATRGTELDARYRALMEEAYGT
jgi:long-chain acyl-CoA synthetase